MTLILIVLFLYIVLITKATASKRLIQWLVVGSSSSHRVRVVDDIISQLSIPNQHCLKALVTHSSHEKRISEHFKAKRIKREEDDKDPWWAKHRLSWLIERQFERKHPACLRLITTMHRALVTRSGRMNSSSPTHASTTLYPIHYIHWLSWQHKYIPCQSKLKCIEIWPQETHFPPISTLFTN